MTPSYFGGKMGDLDSSFEDIMTLKISPLSHCSPIKAL
jgi:hypothetical protein